MKLYTKPDFVAQIIVNGRFEGKQTCRSFEVIGSNVLYKIKSIIEGIYNNMPRDPFNELELRTFQIKVCNVKISTRTTLDLNAYVALMKEYIEFERWDV